MKKFIILLLIIFCSGCRTFTTTQLKIHDEQIYFEGYYRGRLYQAAINIKNLLKDLKNEKTDRM